MPDMKLYFFPRACSRVPMISMIKAGMTFDRAVVNIMKGEQYAPDYLENVHRSGKVPALLVDGTPITENAAIVSFLDTLAPKAGILPQTESLFEKGLQRQDLVWCSATLHPMVRQIRMPHRFTEVGTEGVYALGTKMLTQNMPTIETRLSKNDWWFGDDWSAVDVYLNWLMMTAGSADFPVKDYPATMAHWQRVHALPEFKEVMAIEAQAIEDAAIDFPA